MINKGFVNNLMEKLVSVGECNKVLDGEWRDDVLERVVKIIVLFNVEEMVRIIFEIIRIYKVLVFFKDVI